MLHLLLVDDNATDVLLTQIALEDFSQPHTLSIVSDGIEALAFLHHEAPFETATLPDVILLDLNMPRMGGLEVLQHLKASETLSKIPVFVLLASANEEDVWRSRQLRADGYLPKPIDLASMLAQLEAIRATGTLDPF
ncbi:response regulator [Deinococcus yavapaiensis]|uniref:Response regulator receiver domain-containing protein n=1 Tax=Deinococcus yavapaiensis KR-236 TaxID=694435 RepID=A0A318SB98_9DEIO|nr:response regulator [Deinococcus yavapaiensis]PYE53559.1 response regulator receiver domain-containing protein [Deinococcus yavapaiensis KR-236]